MIADATFSFLALIMVLFQLTLTIGCIIIFILGIIKALELTNVV